MKANFFLLLDVRPRLCLLLLFLVLLFLPLTVWIYGGLFLIFLLSGFASYGVKAALKVLRAILPILILVALLTPPFFPFGRPLLQVGRRVWLSTGGIIQTFILLFRFAGLTLLFFLFYRATGSEELLSCLRWYGLPFSAALVLSLSLRAIPELFDVYRQIRDAHSLRERNPNPEKPPGWFAKIADLVPHLTSVLIVTVKKISPLSMALQTRGAEIKKGRSIFHELSKDRRFVKGFFFVFVLLIIMIFVLVKLPVVWYKVR